MFNNMSCTEFYNNSMLITITQMITTLFPSSTCLTLTLEAFAYLFSLEVGEPWFLHHYWAPGERMGTISNTCMYFNTHSTLHYVSQLRWTTQTRIPTSASSHISSHPGSPCCSGWLWGCSTVSCQLCSVRTPPSARDTQKTASSICEP